LQASLATHKEDGVRGESDECLLLPGLFFASKLKQFPRCDPRRGCCDGDGQRATEEQATLGLDNGASPVAARRTRAPRGDGARHRTRRRNNSAHKATRTASTATGAKSHTGRRSAAMSGDEQPPPAEYVPSRREKRPRGGSRLARHGGTGAVRTTGTQESPRGVGWS
jgi:hypothetical protein